MARGPGHCCARVPLTAAESPGRILLAESPDGQFESYIRSGKVAAPEGEVSGRTRTDHAFIECRDAAVAALLARLSGVRAQGLASGDRGVRISDRRATLLYLEATRFPSPYLWSC